MSKKCPNCQTRMNCIDSRACREYTRRRYACNSCDTRLSSLEVFEETEEAKNGTVIPRLDFIRKFTTEEYAALRVFCEKISKTKGDNL